MLFTTPTQFAVLAILLVAGWLFGLASHPGGRKWKERYAAERDAHAAARRDADARVADANKRVTELERENARLAKAVPPPAPAPAPAPVIERRPAVVAPTSALGTNRVVAPGTRPGWFDFRNRTPTNG